MMSDEIREFPTADVLSAVTGWMVSEEGLGGVYDVLNWMTGENLFTHQLPRVGREARAAMLELAEAVVESEQVTAENWRHWLAVWEVRYGRVIAVPRFTAGQHRRIDPMTELSEAIGPENIVVIGS